MRISSKGRHADEAGTADLRGRRRFLAQVGIGGAVLGAGSTLLPAVGLLPSAAQEGEEVTDDDLAAFMASAELAAVEVYAKAVEAGELTGGALAAAGRFSDHHQQHADALDAEAGTSSEANAGIVDSLWGTPVENAVDELSWLNVLLGVEQDLAATYTTLLREVEGAELAGIMASILAVEGQQAVVLGHATDELEPNQYLPAFQLRTGAINPAAYPTEQS